MCSIVPYLSVFYYMVNELILSMIIGIILATVSRFEGRVGWLYDLHEARE